MIVASGGIQKFFDNSVSTKKQANARVWKKAPLGRNH